MSSTRRDRRAALITAGCIGAVALAGAFAVGANLGILDASADTKIGTLSAAGDLLAPTTTPTGEVSVAEVATADSTPSSATPAPASSRTYAVDVAGTVSIATDGDRLVLTGVVANPGWTWAQPSAGDDRVEVMFSDGRRVLVFDATPTAGGAFDATVGESAVTATTTAGAASVVPVDDHEQHEREGRDDDD